MSSFIKDDLSNKWRNILGITILLVTVFLFLALNADNIRASFKKNLSAEQSLVARIVSQSEADAGGDIAIVPPHLVEPRLPELVSEMLDPDTFSAGSVLVKDHETGTILYKKNEYNVRSIASITKLMSVLVLLEHEIDWSTSTTVIGEDILDTHMYKGDTFTLEELWQAALIASSNKAILTLVNYIDWSEETFVERMNQKAVELGMSDTHFTGPSGLDAGNVSSASDISILLDEALRYEKITKTLKTKELNIYSSERKKNHHMWNTNWLILGWISHDFADFYGGKTGYIPASGYNFIMQVGDGERHIINTVILGASSHEARFIEARDVASWVFENYKWPDEQDFESDFQITSTTDPSGLIMVDKY